jgi:serine protease AprX
MKDKRVAFTVLTTLCATALLGAQNPPPSTPSLAEKARQAAGEGKIAYKLTTPEELNGLLGPAQSEKKDQDGGTEMLTLQYPDLTARFTRMRGYTAPFTLQMLSVRVEWLESLLGLKKGGAIDIGRDRQIVLHSADDLAKFDPFWGFAGVSLAGLDLREQKATLEKMPFDSRTQWPPQDKLPEGFDPVRRLEEGKGPGLGVAGLHAQGIDGHGVGIAIIDQPLLKEHQEYATQLVHYEAIDLPPWIDVQMHGPPVSSIAVGQKCGVAPKAALYYYAIPMWGWQANKAYAELIEKIIEFNKTLTDRPKIRVVSVSLGMFSTWPDFDLWKAAVDKAAQNGILVVTCDPAFLRLATLRRDPDGDPNDPTCYRTGRYSHRDAVLCVPAGNRTTASHQGPNVYTYWVEGGMSWTVPYLAGLAALAFQIDPEIPPAQIVEFWTSTATRTSAGPVVNPPRFISAVRSRAKNKAP